MTAEVNVTTKSIQNNILLNINKMIKRVNQFTGKNLLSGCVCYYFNYLKFFDLFIAMLNIVTCKLKIPSRMFDRVLNTPLMSKFFDALRNLVPFVQFKNVKTPTEECYFCMLKACNFIKSKTSLWVFFTFFKLCKWHQITQNITVAGIL